MKIAFILLLLAVPAITFSQSDRDIKQQVALIPKGTKQITMIVDSTHSEQTLLKGVVSYLMDQNFEIDQVNESLGVVQTKTKVLKTWYGVRLTLRVSKGAIRIRGKSQSNIDPTDHGTDAENRSGLNELNNTAFREMVRVSNGLPHKSISYSK